MAFSPDQIKHLTKASNDFPYFVNNIFKYSTKHFVGGEYVDWTARFLSQNRKTIRVSARDHFKSFSFYAHFMWKLMFEGAISNIEGHYFSFNADLAGYHIGKIKACIESNPFFDELVDKKPTAESVLRYSWDRKHYTTLTPHGLVQFKRGIHADLIYVDDPFQDPDNELNPTIIYKINEIFKSNILDMPNEPDGELHCAGTPQTKEDFFFDKVATQRFAVKILPALTKNPITGEEQALWPEWMSVEELHKKEEERTTRIFKREYMCTPVYSTKSFFNKEKLTEAVVNSNLSNWNPFKRYEHNNDIYAGFDIGKKAHPSHLVVYERREDKLVMVYQRFLDGWAYTNGGKEFTEAYPSQIEFLKLCIKNFGIKELRYDNTRGEFESLLEQGLLPKQMVPMVFTTKMRNDGATVFDRLVEKKQIEIMKDDRFLDQICSVMDDLHSAQTSQGHGDSFWSNVLAFYCLKDLFGFFDEDSGDTRRKIKTGVPSIFGEDSKIPTGF